MDYRRTFLPNINALTFVKAEIYRPPHEYKYVNYYYS